jgi:hypothetical protein
MDVFLEYKPDHKRKRCFGFFGPVQARRAHAFCILASTANNKPFHYYCVYYYTTTPTPHCSLNFITTR